MADCDERFKKVAHVKIVSSGVERRLLEAVEGLESNESVPLPRNLFKVL